MGDEVKEKVFLKHVLAMEFQCDFLMGFWVGERELSITWALSITSKAQSSPTRRLSSLGARREPTDGVEWCSILSEVLVLPDIQVYFSQVLFCGIELSLILFSTLLFIDPVAQDFMRAAIVTCRR
ncbi:hypothetical protein GRJ2_002008400 [Grus japonensis]|uniref:Uncharacterized protein n=1 Tax=Grus japonensis TaxID=30415 RepID=A0ABC9XCL2_GRUJA